MTLGPVEHVWTVREAMGVSRRLIDAIGDVLDDLEQAMPQTSTGEEKRDG